MTDLILSEPNDYRNLLRLDVPSVGEMLKNVISVAVSTNSDTI
jgi:hypothetical protein